MSATYPNVTFITMSMKPIIFVSELTNIKPRKQSNETPKPIVLTSLRTNNRLNFFVCMSLSLARPAIRMPNTEVRNGIEEISPSFILSEKIFNGCHL
jgi:hypothetical protein